MKRSYLSVLIVAAFLLLRATTASAVPVVSIDLDPGTAGIQTTRTVDPGEVFSIDVVYTGDGVAVFDFFAFDVVFNDLGAGVLGLSGGTGLPTAGTIAGTAPFLALDVFSAGIVVPGSALTPSGVPFPPPAPFTAQSDGLGILSIVLPFGGVVGAGVTIDLFSLTLVGGAVGMSTVLPSDGFPLGGLALAGLAVPVLVPSDLASGTVNVVPEPGTLLLLSSGIAGLAVLRRSKKTA